MANNKKVIIIGAGLAGCEASYQLLKRNYQVDLYEMRPLRSSPAHRTADFAELVCSNSLKSDVPDTSSGLLKSELTSMDSLLIDCAYKTRVEAGGTLAVDRAAFSKEVERRLLEFDGLTVIREEVESIPDGVPVIVASGPLTSDKLFEDISKKTGDRLFFFDAVAPIVDAQSIDYDFAFESGRYGKGDGYINCPMNKEEYEAFYEALVGAESAETHSFDKRKGVYEGCMPIEVMALRGKDTIRFGPMKPVGLRDPRTGHRPWAVLQLRKENSAGTMYNLVGFQTNLKFGEQKRVFSMIPALKNAEFVRYGVMHRNTFINSPRLLGADFSLRSDRRIFFAGQITGVEGYMESAVSGILAGINAARYINGKDPFVMPGDTVMGALARYISDESVTDFQPMGANFGILPPLDERIRSKQERYEKISQRGLESARKYIEGENEE